MEIRRALRGGGLALKIAPVTVKIQSAIPAVEEALLLFYGDRDVPDCDAFVDFHVNLAASTGIRRWLGRQVEFVLDGVCPFKPLPHSQAYPLFEWGLNWCVAQHLHHVLSVHAAVIARADRAVILPAPPGSGKSTLCAGLVSRGWRLLSDEMALLRPEDLQLIPFPRPISLKNQSIEIIRGFAPSQVIGPAYRDTHKGDVAHMKPPPQSVGNAAEPAHPRWIIFPRFVVGAAATLVPMTKAEAVVRLAENSFNYAKLGSFGFRLLTRLVGECEAYSFEYSQLDEAAALFDGLEGR